MFIPICPADEFLVSIIGAVPSEQSIIHRERWISDHKGQSLEYNLNGSVTCGKYSFYGGTRGFQVERFTSKEKMDEFVNIMRRAAWVDEITVHSSTKMIRRIVSTKRYNEYKSSGISQIFPQFNS